MAIAILLLPFCIFYGSHPNSLVSILLEKRAVKQIIYWLIGRDKLKHFVYWLIQLRKFKQAEKQALIASEQGNEEAARLAMSRAIAIERLLHRIAEQVAQSEKVVMSTKQKLYCEREKLEVYKTERENLKALAEINETLASISEVDNSLNINSARDRFENALSAVEGRYLQVNARAELSESHVEQLQTDLDRIALDEEISARLAKLKESN